LLHQLSADVINMSVHVSLTKGDAQGHSTQSGGAPLDIIVLRHSAGHRSSFPNASASVINAVTAPTSIRQALLDTFTVRSSAESRAFMLHHWRRFSAGSRDPIFMHSPSSVRK
jgi:aspartate carbamoyltransferase catalytic subunit